MSQYWKITLKPLDAYFLGGERNSSFANSSVQLSERKPYFIRSNRVLSQSAAFGVLRYLGIREPRANFTRTTEDIANIGECSYSLAKSPKLYGRIRSISPVLLEDAEGNRYATAPWNRTQSNRDETTGVGSCHPFASYHEVSTMDGRRWLPEDYEEKKACDSSELICLESGAILASPFTSTIRTGINRASQRLVQQDADDEDTPSGFFRKEYVLLRDEFSFLYYAETDDGFFIHRDTVAYIGQGRTPFAAHVEPMDKKWDLTLPACCFPLGRDWESATALSDLYFEGHSDEIRSQCSLMIAFSRIHRCMETNYMAKSAEKRYTKNNAHKLIPAGSVFLFCGGDREQRIIQFRSKLEGTKAWNRARIAGFNCLAYSTDSRIEGN